MKRVVVAVLLFTTIVSGCLFSYNKLDLLTQELANHVLQSDALLETGDREGANSTFQEAYHLWTSKRATFGSLVSHDELDSIEVLFLRALKAMENNDDAEYYLQSFELHGVILHIPEMEMPSVQNIF